MGGTVPESRLMVDGGIDACGSAAAGYERSARLLGPRWRGVACGRCCRYGWAIVTERVLGRMVVAAGDWERPLEPKGGVQAWVGFMLIGLRVAVGSGVGASLGLGKGRVEVDKGGGADGVRAGEVLDQARHGVVEMKADRTTVVRGEVPCGMTVVVS